ncbi:MAG: hypothetical protein ACXW2C_07260 [Acidimicrobiia bacterium]
MNVEVGPVSHASAVAWLDYATEALADLRTAPASPVSPHALELFADLLAEWRAIAATDDRWRWTAEMAPEKVEFLIRALYEAGLVIEHESAAKRARLRPPEADEFHVVLVECVLAALEAEGGSSAQFVESLRNEWDIARRT